MRQAPGSHKRVAVVSGGNRGIGLEIVKQLAQRGLQVVLGSRDEQKGRAAAEALCRDGLGVEAHALDVTSKESIGALASFLKDRYGGLDVLVNNAGIAMKGFDADVARRTTDANFFGALHLTDALLPLMRTGGRIVMVSSGVADVSGLPERLRDRLLKPDLTRDELSAFVNEFVADVRAGTHAEQGWPSSAYRISKAAMNALTMILGRQLANDPRGVLCNAVCPGWVRTDMGGPHAERPVEKGAETPVWLALLPEGGPQGRYFRDKKEVPW